MSLSPLETLEEAMDVIQQIVDGFAAAEDSPEPLLDAIDKMQAHLMASSSVHTFRTAVVCSAAIINLRAWVRMLRAEMDVIDLEEKFFESRNN